METNENSKISLIVGLANPGKTYEKTRHNAGAWWVESLLKKYNENLKLNSKLFCKIADIKIASLNVKTAIPLTYMNESGKAISFISKFYKIPPDEILIVHDDLDLEPGKIKFKFGGGHAGHNGLNSIISTIGSNNFARLRIGIGHPGNKNQVSNYVLKQPNKEDKEKIMLAINISLDFINDIILKNFNVVQNLLHSLNL